MNGCAVSLAKYVHISIAKYNDLTNNVVSFYRTNFLCANEGLSFLGIGFQWAGTIVHDCQRVVVV
jgi:hypothetical protein